MLLIARGEQPNIASLINSYLMGRKGPSLGNKTEQARDEGKAQGFRTGVAAGLATWVNIKRGENLRHLKMVPAITDLDIEQALRPFVDEYFEARNAPKSEAAKDGLEFTPFESFLMKAYMAVTDLIVTPELLEAENKVRRELVLKGEVEPSFDDAEWIDGEREKARKVIEQFDALAEKVNHQ